MSLDVKSITNTSSSPAEPSSAERAQIKALAQQFEAMLMTQMLREMRKSMIGEEEDEPEGLGADTMSDTADIELGLALSRTGGIGLTDALLSAFERQIDATQAGSSESPVLVPPAEAIRSGGAVLEGITSPAPVSSDFGWRRDPITGESRFHQGVDIAVAYGHDVKSAADGVVAFAGVQNGYGTTVVVNHEGGRQTRYAHLSEPLVRAGDVVTEGQLVGRSGNSGRSTAPHLHFEMLVGGRPVDPAE